MLLADVAAWFKDTAVSAFTNVMLYMSYGIYNMITWLYNVFVIIAKARFVTSDVIQDLTSRLYLLVGIISLFLVAYSFLMVIVNPDNMTKGKYATTAMVKNIILAVVTITFVPTIFNFSYAVQKSILDKDVIGRVILDKGAGQVDTGDDYMADLSISIFETSFYLSGSTDTVNPDYVTQYDTCAAQAKTYNDVKFFSGCVTLVQEGAIEYNPLMSVIIGLVVIYVLGLYCIDMGLRTVKLVFLQIIAPIPCLLMIVPGQDKVFKSWVKETLKTFMEVFLKILVLTLGIYMIQLVTNVFANYSDEAFGPISQISVRVFVKLFIIFGILMFVNKAPKLIGDIFGIDLGYGLSLKKRMDDIKSGFNTLTTPFNKAAGAIGGYAAARKAYKTGLKTGNKGSTVKSALASFHGIRNGWNGGIKNIGKAYDYELAVQDSYAHTRTKGGFTQVMSGIGDSLRDNFGFGSRYDYIKKRAELERDYKNAGHLATINNLQQATNQKMSQIQGDHKSYINDNQRALDAATKWDDAREKELSKQNSEEKFVSKKADLSDDVRMSASYRANENNSFKISYTDSSGKTDTYNYHELKAKRDTFAPTSAEYASLDSAMRDWNSQYKSYVHMTSNMNWSQLEAMADRAMKNKDISEADRKKIINAVDAAKDSLKVQYSEKDLADQSSSVRLAYKEYINILKDSHSNIGKSVIVAADGSTRDSKGNFLGDSEIIARTDIDTACLDVSHAAELGKLKKKISKLIDAENENINLAFSEGKIEGTVVIFDEDGTKHEIPNMKFIEADRIIKDRQTKVEELNKATEKLIESYVSEKENAERHKHIAGMRKNNGGKP